MAQPGRDDYYYANGRRVPLERDARAYAVKYRAGVAPRFLGLPPRSQRFVQEDSTHQSFVPTYGLQVYTVQPRAVRLEADGNVGEQLREELRALNRADSVEYATPVFRQSAESSRPMYVTDRLLVRFKADAAQEAIAELHERHRVEVVRALGYVDGGYLLRATDLAEMDIVEIANAYYESGLTEWAHPDLVPQRSFKALPAHGRQADVPLAERAVAEQWHLDLTRVTGAWAITRGSPAVRIAVLDDGVDVHHPELAGRTVAQFDFDAQSADGGPKTVSDNHGTACASVALARGQRAWGSAPECSIIAVRTPSFLANAEEAEMFRWAADEGADAISCSWGPPDNDGPMALPDATRAAIAYCLAQGRQGRGIPIFFAAGNGNESVSNDGYAANPQVMAVAASTSEDVRAPYSDFGPEIWVAAPSSGGSRAVFTADRRGAAGYNPSRGGPADDQGYFESFGGTSSATPLVAGICALMLSANPQLRAEEVREILRDTAVKIGDPGSYVGGHSTLYGHGRVDALAAVQAAAARAGQAGAGGPSIGAAESVPRAGASPSFAVDTAGRSLFAVEVATRAELFDADAHGGERTADDFFGSWERGLSNNSPYALPDDVWARLRHADRLFYRAHVADDAQWSNYDVTVSDAEAASAPSLRITGASGGAGPTGGSAPSGDGGVGGSASRSITFPSGATFEEAATPADGVDYRDPVMNGAVPLVEVQGRLDEQLSRNFQVRELAARRLDRQGMVRYARISPELVAGLQRLRDRVGAAITVNSGYRYPALNDQVGGVAQSQHMVGWAADIRCSAVTPLELARLALEEIGCDVGIGLGANSVHIDLRPSRASWTYEGSELDEAGFDAFVRERCQQRSVRSARREATLREAMGIVGPEGHDASAEPPAFRIESGSSGFFGVEIARDWRLFDRAHHTSGRTPDTFFASWTNGLTAAGASTWVLPSEAWQRLRDAPRLYYRLVTSSANDGSWAGYRTTVPDEEAEAAPWIDIKGVSLPRVPEPTVSFASEGARRLLDEAKWHGS